MAASGQPCGDGRRTTRPNWQAMAGRGSWRRPAESDRRISFDNNPGLVSFGAKLGRENDQMSNRATSPGQRQRPTIYRGRSPNMDQVRHHVRAANTDALLAEDGSPERRNLDIGAEDRKQVAMGGAISCRLPDKQSAVSRMRVVVSFSLFSNSAKPKRSCAFFIRSAPFPHSRTQRPTHGQTARARE